MTPITIFLFFVPVLVLILLFLNVLFAVKKPDAEKVTPYECGFDSFSQTRSPFSIQFYLVGILFIVFDLELLFIYPWAISLYNISLIGFWLGIIFLLILTIGFVYEFGKGALKFTDHRASITAPNTLDKTDR